MTSFLKVFSKRKDDEMKAFHGGVAYYKHDVSEYDKTFAVPRTILRLLGLRLTRKDTPFFTTFWLYYYWFEFVNILFAVSLEIISMVQTARGGSFQDAIDIFRMLPCVGYVFMAMTKSYKLVLCRPVYENLVSELRDMWPQEPVGEEEHQIIDTASRNLNILVQGYYWCNNALLLIFLSPPFLELFKVIAGYDTSLLLPFFYWFPFDPFKRGYYELILFIQTWHGTITIWFLLCGDCLFCIFLCHVSTQFDLLAVKIRRMFYVPVDDQLLDSFPLGAYSKEYLGKNNAESFTSQDWEQRHQKEITEIVNRHHALIRLSNDIERMSSFSLLVNFINSSFVLCFCGFCVVIVEKWNELVYKTFLLTALCQTWMLCWCGQRLMESSEGVSTALYNSGWYQASRKIKSNIFIMMHRSQKQVTVTTYGFSVLCLASYTTIIKSAWSYFTLVLNIYKQ